MDPGPRIRWRPPDAARSASAAGVQRSRWKHGEDAHEFLHGWAGNHGERVRKGGGQANTGGGDGDRRRTCRSSAWALAVDSDFCLCA